MDNLLEYADILADEICGVQVFESGGILTEFNDTEYQEGIIRILEGYPTAEKFNEFLGEKDSDIYFDMADAGFEEVAIEFCNQEYPENPEKVDTLLEMNSHFINEAEKNCKISYR